MVSTAAPSRRLWVAWAEWRAPLGRAALALWLPALLPFAVGPLSECGHCVGVYLRLVPVLPGFFAAAWVRNEMVAFYALAFVATLAVLAACALLIALAGRRWPAVAVPVALLAGAQAIGLGHALRM